jgi:hypothetical protein
MSYNWLLFAILEFCVAIEAVLLWILNPILGVGFFLVGLLAAFLIASLFPQHDERRLE